MTGELLTVAQAAEAAGVSKATIHNWLKSGILEGYRLGPRAVRVDPSDLDKVVTPYHSDAAA